MDMSAVYQTIIAVLMVIIAVQSYMLLRRTKQTKTPTTGENAEKSQQNLLRRQDDLCSLLIETIKGAAAARLNGEQVKFEAMRPQGRFGHTILVAWQVGPKPTTIGSMTGSLPILEVRISPNESIPLLLSVAGKNRMPYSDTPSEIAGLREEVFGRVLSFNPHTTKRFPTLT